MTNLMLADLLDPNIIALLIFALITGLGQMLKGKQADPNDQASPPEPPSPPKKRPATPATQSPPPVAKVAPRPKSKRRPKSAKPKRVTPAEHAAEVAHHAEKAASHLGNTLDDTVDGDGSMRATRGPNVSRDSLRQAIILSEILQPPLALRDRT